METGSVSVITEVTQLSGSLESAQVGWQWLSSLDGSIFWIGIGGVCCFFWLIALIWVIKDAHARSDSW